MKSDKTKRVLASMVMGLNCVNTLAPMTTLVTSDIKTIPTKVEKVTQAPAESYTAACYQALDMVDHAVFGQAEAAFTPNVGTAYATSSVNGETVDGVQQNIYAGGTASNGTIEGAGRQTIYTGGTGHVQLMAADAIGAQYVSSGGSGVILTMNGGAQAAFAGAGYVHIETMNDGAQRVFNGGTATIATMNAGEQLMAANATGTIATMNNGTQSIRANATGTVAIMNGGTQVVAGAGKATIYGGTQIILGGTSFDTVLSGAGIQDFSGGTVTNLSLQSGGVQNISSTGTFTGISFQGGTQNVFAGEQGNAITSMYVLDGVQNVQAGGYTSLTSAGSKGVQNVLANGAAVETYVSNGGVQNVETGGRTSVTFMYSGSQNVNGGSAEDSYIYAGGVQNVSGGGAHDTYIYSGGVQNVSNGRAWENTIYTGAEQNISGGLALTNDLSGGVQNVSGGTAHYNNLFSGAVQNVVGGTASVNNVNRSTVQNISGGTAVSNYVFSAQENVLGGTALYTSVYNGGIQKVSSGIAISNIINSGGEQIVSGGTATSNTVSTGGSQTIFGGTAENNTMQSGTNQIVSGGSSLNTTLENGANLYAYSGHVSDVEFGDNSEVVLYNAGVFLGNVNMSGGTIRLGADGGTYNIDGTFNFAGGVVDLISNPDGTIPTARSYETLNIANLQGQGGTFKLDTDLDKAVYGSETTNGDKIVILSGDPAATQYIQVADESLYTGTEITGDRKLLLVTDNSGANLVMIGKDLNNGGLWVTHAPELFREGNKWYIGYIPKEASNDTTVYLSDRQVAVYNQWTRISNDSLRKRLGDLRYNESEAGLWARYYAGKLSGSGYEQNYHTYQVGIDKTNGNSAYGLALERQESNQSYTYGNGEGTTNAGNIYYTKYTASGSYFDAIFKYGKINSKYNTTGDFPDSADYDTPAYSLSLEYGKTNKYKAGYFFEPKVQLTYGHINGTSYNTDRGTLLEESAIKSLIGRVGFVAGRKINKDSDYYFKAGWFREFKGDRDVHLQAANGENMYKSENYGDSWFEIGLGGNVKLAKKTHLYGDIEKSIGADVQKKWQVNAGVRWEF